LADPSVRPGQHGSWECSALLHRLLSTVRLASQPLYFPERPNNLSHFGSSSGEPPLKASMICLSKNVLVLPPEKLLRADIEALVAGAPTPQQIRNLTERLLQRAA
jgi:hypothetical protein